MKLLNLPYFVLIILEKDADNIVGVRITPAVFLKFSLAIHFRNALK